MKRKAQKVATHARVLDAARTCFRERDERDVSMQDIAEGAGTSVGAIYVHFRNREALVDSIIEELQGELVSGIKAALVATDEESMSAAIGRISHSYVHHLGALRPYFSLLASHSSRTMTADVVRAGGLAAPLFQMLNATLGSLGSTVQIRGDVALLAGGIAALWRGAALSYAVRPSADAGVIADSLAEMTLAILERLCPGVLKLDARRIMRGMAHYLKDKNFIT